MSASYIYSASRVRALEKEFITEADIDRLLTTNNENEVIKVLRDTYLANFITGTTTTEIFKAIEKSKLEAKNVLEKISPELNSLDFLWLRFDLHNLRLILRAKKADLNLEEIKPYLSYLGKYDPEILIQHINAGTLERLDLDFKIAYEKALRLINEQGISEADVEIDKSYFSIALKLAEKTNDPVIMAVVKLQIDLFNLKTRLRTLSLDRVADEVWFVKGGSFDFSAIDSKEKTLAKLITFGGEKFWREAIESYEKKGHSTLIDVNLDDYLLLAVKKMDEDVFSIATLILYFLKYQNMSAVVQAILVGKESGQADTAIRTQLRNIYV